MSNLKIQYSEADLVELLKLKDRKAMGYLYENYSKVLYGLIIKGIGKDEASKDILQEVFLKIWKNIDGYNPERGRLYTWMINIARNAVIDYLRSSQNQKELKNQSIDLSVNDINKTEKVEQEIDNIGLKQIVENLPQSQKEVIDMVYFRGYTQDETSKNLEIPLGTVKTRVRSAINALRTIYRE